MLCTTLAATRYRPYRSLAIPVRVGRTQACGSVDACFRPPRHPPPLGPPCSITSPLSLTARIALRYPSSPPLIVPRQRAPLHAFVQRLKSCSRPQVPHVLPALPLSVFPPVSTCLVCVSLRSRRCQLYITLKYRLTCVLSNLPLLLAHGTTSVRHHVATHTPSTLSDDTHPTVPATRPHPPTRTSHIVPSNPPLCAY